MNRAPHWIIGDGRARNPFRNIPTVGNAIGLDDTPGLSMWGDSDDYDLDELDDELDDIEGDLDMVQNPVELGAVFGRLRDADRRRGRLQKKASKGNGRKADRAERRLLAMDQKINRHKEKYKRKQAALAKRFGVTPGAVSAVGPQGVEDRARIFSESAGYAESGQFGVIERTPYSGAEIRLPFLEDGDPYSVYTFPAGAAQTQTLNLATAIIPYAGFIVRGVDCTLKIARGENSAGFPNQDILLNMIVNSIKVNGKLDLTYGAAPVEFVSQGVDGARRALISLRENPELEQNNTAQATVVVRQEITTAEAFSWSVSFALIVERLRDPAASMSF